LQLTGLAFGPAMTLLERELDRPLAPEERVAAADFLRVVDGQPLALIQAAAAMQTAAVDGVPADQIVLAQALATGLTPVDHTVLSALVCLDSIDVPPQMAAMLSGTPAIKGIVDRLQQAQLVIQGPQGLRALVPAARIVAESAQDARHADNVKRYASALAAWAAMAQAQEIGDAAAIVVRVLNAAAASGEYSIAVKIARATAPALCRTLNWGAWRQVLALGKTAAQVVGSPGDAAYFDREENARRKALGIGLTIGLAAGGSFTLGRQLAVHNPAASTSARGCLVSPAVIGSAVAVIVAVVLGTLGYAITSYHEPARPPSSPVAIGQSTLTHRSSAPVTHGATPSPLTPSVTVTSITSTPGSTPSQRQSSPTPQPQPSNTVSPSPPLQISVTATVTPSSYTGSCAGSPQNGPFGVEFSPTISVNKGPVTVTYRNVINGTVMPAETQTFPGTGPQEEAVDGGFQVIIQSGNFSGYTEVLKPFYVRSNTANATITCK
jgi:hypothetical protein